MKTRSVHCPLDEATARELRAGEIITLDGIIYGLRDATLRRLFDEGAEPPEDLRGAVCLHTAPNARKRDGRWEKICIGTTTSARMERFTEPLMAGLGARAIIGKGGLGPDSLATMERHGGVYLAIVGGAAALSTLQIEGIEAVWLEDLFPECLWRLRVRDFGPLTVAMDSHGRSLYSEVRKEAQARMEALAGR